MKFLVVATVALAWTQAIAYDWVFNPANGHWYASWVVTGDGWQAAQDEAVTLGGNLVTINDQAENNWVRSTFDGYDYYWVGLYYDQVADEWEWASGESLDYQNWAPGQPDTTGGAFWGAISEHVTPLGSWVALSGDQVDEWIGLGHLAVVEVVAEPSSLLATAFCLFVLARRRN